MSFGIALTGHRPAKLAGYRMDDPFYRRLQDRLEDGIERAVAVHGSVVSCCVAKAAPTAVLVQPSMPLVPRLLNQRWPRTRSKSWA